MMIHTVHVYTVKELGIKVKTFLFFSVKSFIKIMSMNL